MSITIQFGSGVPQATQDAANSLANSINNSGIFKGNKTITISNFSAAQLNNLSAQTGNTNGVNNSQIQINQNFNYEDFNKDLPSPAVTLAGSILHELTHALYPGAAGSDKNVHNATFYIDELNLAEAIGVKVDYSDVYKAEQALQRDQGLSANDAQNAIANFPSSGIQPTGQTTGSHIDYQYDDDGVDPRYIQSISSYDQNGVLSGTASLQDDGSWSQISYANGSETLRSDVDSTGNNSNAVYYANGNISYNVDTSVDANTGAVTATVQGYNAAGAVTTQAESTPDPNGDGGSSISLVSGNQTAGIGVYLINAAQVTPTTNGAFTIGSSQPDNYGYTNQLSLAATSSFGINGLNVTDPATGQTTSVPLDNGSATTLQEGRSVATGAPNELASTTQPNGPTTDTAFGQGATVTDANATVNAATPGGSVNLAATGDTLNGTGATFAMAPGLANASYTLGGTDATLNLNPNATTSATVDGGGSVGLSASNQTLTLGDPGTTVQVASNLQGETIAGSGVIVTADGLVYGNLVGNDNTFDDTSNGGTYYGLAGTGDVVTGTNDSFEDLYAGTLTLQGTGDAVNLHTSDDTLYASAGDTIQAAAGSGGDTFYASGVTLNADGLNGSNLFGDDNVVNLQGSGNSGVGFTGTGDVVTAQGDFINDGAASLTLDGGGNTISLRWRFHTPRLLRGHVTSVN